MKSWTLVVLLSLASQAHVAELPFRTLAEARSRAIESDTLMCPGGTPVLWLVIDKPHPTEEWDLWLTRTRWLLVHYPNGGDTIDMVYAGQIDGGKLVLTDSVPFPLVGARKPCDWLAIPET